MPTSLYALIALYLAKHWDNSTFNGLLSEKCEGQKVFFNFLWILCDCFSNHHTQVEWLAFEIFQTTFWLTQRTKCFSYSVKSIAVLIIDFTHLWHQPKIWGKLVNGFWNCLLYNRSIWWRKLFLSGRYSGSDRFESWPQHWLLHGLLQSASVQVIWNLSLSGSNHSILDGLRLLPASLNKLQIKKKLRD